MEKRSSEAPMDFEWQTRGPGDVTSPFYKLAMEHESHGKKRPYSIFDSSPRPMTPTLREPNSQPFLFNQLPAASNPISRSSAFTTPRKIDLDFSSGAENPSSPENADNEDTPEQPKSNRRNSLFGLYGRFAPSSGRGEIPRSNKFSNVLVRRVQKRRRRERDIDRQLHRMSDDSDRPSSSEGAATHTTGLADPQPQPEIFLPFISRLFTFLESHPHIPRILSYYAQFLFNIILAFLTLYVIVAFLLAIRSDVNRASEEVSADILAEMAVCAKNYVENRCSGEDGKRLPALELVCDNWERCMNRDPAKVGRAKVSAQTLAEIFNGFIEPISFKTMFFFIASITSCFAVSNLTFSFFRNKSNNPPSPPMVHPYVSFPSQKLPRQQSQISYTHGHPVFGMERHYADHAGSHSLIENVNVSPRKTGREREDGLSKQIDGAPRSGYSNLAHPRTPSPIKRERKFA